MTWILVFGCLAVSFVFSGIEAGILSVNRVRLRHRVKTRDRAAIRLKQLLTNPERFLVTVLIVTNLMKIPWEMDSLLALEVIVACVFVTLAAGFSGTWRALGTKAAPLLRNE